MYAQTAPVSVLPDDSGYARRSGTTVQPFYEGWQKMPNGKTVMWFGYLNRNFEEETDVPLGAENKFDLHPDMGQPTHFYPRRHLFVFNVEIPDNWPADKRLVWTVTAHGKAPQTASGWLKRCNAMAVCATWNSVDCRADGSPSSVFFPPNESS